MAYTSMESPATGTNTETVVEPDITAAVDAIASTIDFIMLCTGAAGEYVDRYHAIHVPEYRLNAGRIEKTAKKINVPVREYLNRRFTNHAGITPNIRLGLKDFLLSSLGAFFAGHLKVESKSDTLTISRDGITLLSVSKATVSSCFYGKGTPEMLAQTIELLGLWILFCHEVKEIERKTLTVGHWEVEKGKKVKKTFSHTYEIEDLQTMADSYLGVDCNGFTGRYLKAKYRWLDISPDTTEESYVSGGGHGKGPGKDESHLRKKPADITIDDTAVFNNGSYHHVAMVSQILLRADDHVLLTLAESRSAQERHGGPQQNVWRVEPKRKQQRDGKGAVIEGKFKLAGRPGDTVEFVAPHRFRV